MGNNQNNRSRKFSFYNILFFAIIPIIIVALLLGKTIYVYETVKIINQSDWSSFIVDSNLLDMGIAIIGIAVSVWLGINISNLVDRRQIEELNVRINSSTQNWTMEKNE